MNEPGTRWSSVLDTLWETVGARATARDVEASYTARLLSKGVDRVAQKVGEEAIETAIAGVRGDSGAVIRESADLLYHLLVLWKASGVEPDAVAAELARRAGKASRA